MPHLMPADPPIRADALSPGPPMDAFTVHLGPWLAEPVRGWAGQAGLNAAGLLAAAWVAGGVAFLLIWLGDFGLGLFLALIFLVLAIAGEPRRLANWSSALVPLTWSWAWAHALASSSTPLSPLYGLMVLWAAVGGGLADLVVRLLFNRRFAIHLDDWQRFDTRFMVVAAGAAINVALLAAGWAVGRPDAALVVVAWWTIVTALIHALRLAEATDRKLRGKSVTAWRA